MKQELIDLYKKNGWNFAIEGWVNGHNGNDEVSYYFSSPRTAESVGMYKSVEEITEKELLDKEALAIAYDEWEEKKEKIEEEFIAKRKKEMRLKPLSKEGKK